MANPAHSIHLEGKDVCEYVLRLFNQVVPEGGISAWLVILIDVAVIDAGECDGIEHDGCQDEFVEWRRWRDELHQRFAYGLFAAATAGHLLRPLVYCS